MTKKGQQGQYREKQGQNRDSHGQVKENKSPKLFLIFPVSLGKNLIKKREKIIIIAI